MQAKDSSSRYGILSMLFHWSIATLFLVQFYLIKRRPYLPEDAPERGLYMLLHKSIGVTLLPIALAFLIWRLKNLRPRLPGHIKPHEIFLARTSHTLLYAIMLIMPISGYLMSTFFGGTTSFFGLFNLPMLVGQNEAASAFFSSMHTIGANCFIGLAIFHIAAALKHHFVGKNDILRRMLPAYNPSPLEGEKE